MAATIRKINVGDHRGNRRLWMEGLWLLAANFQRGFRYNLTVTEAGVILQLNDQGSLKVSGKTKNGKDVPIIDLNSQQISHLSDTVTAVLESGRITIVNQ